MKRIISILLASILLFNSVGFAINTHFCEGIAVDSSISMGVEHLDCGMLYNGNHANRDSKEQVNKQSCCENSYQLIEVDQNHDSPFPSFDLTNSFFIAFINTFIINVTGTEQAQVTYITSPPPLVKQDIQILYQTFLI